MKTSPEMKVGWRGENTLFLRLGVPKSRFYVKWEIVYINKHELFGRYSEDELL